MASYPKIYPPPPPTGDNRNDRRYQRDQARARRDLLRAQRQAYSMQIRASRRGSIVGPLLIIALGVVLLMVQTGTLDGHRLAFWYGHWWPVLFVAAGCLLLLEWIFDNGLHRNPERPYVRRGLGGGVVFLLLLLAFTGIGIRTFEGGPGRFFGHAFNLNEDDIDQFLGEKHESDQVLDQPFPAGASLNVTDPHGDVSIAGTSDDGQIHINAHKEVYTRSDSEAAARAQRLAPQIASSDGVVSVNVAAIQGARADLVITVPSTVPVTINANHGAVKLALLKAPVVILANHGSVDVSAITGSVTAHVNRGGSFFSAHSITGPLLIEGRASDLTLADINGTVTMKGEFFGTTHLEHITRPVSFHTSRTDLDLARLDGEAEISSDDLSATEAIGPVRVASRSHNIRLERVAGDVAVTDLNGTVDLTSAPPMGNVTLQDRNGNVNFTAPDGAAFSIQAQTTDGDLQNEFSIPLQENDARKSLSGTIGHGGPSVRIETSQGDISIRRARIAPLPPPPPPPPPLTSSDGSPVLNQPGAPVIYFGQDGTRYTRAADGSRSYMGPDGTRITVERDGTAVGIGPGGRVLSDREITDRLRQGQEAAEAAALHPKPPLKVH